MNPHVRNNSNGLALTNWRTVDSGPTTMNAMIPPPPFGQRVLIWGTLTDAESLAPEFYIGWRCHLRGPKELGAPSEAYTCELTRAMINEDGDPVNIRYMINPLGWLPLPPIPE